MTAQLTVNRKGKASLALTIASILLILIIGAIGVQTITSCSSGGDGNGDDNGGGGNVVYGTPVDYDGEIYKTVVIGTQTWMVRNLNYNASGSKCYDNSDANCAKYGRLYDWETARTVCPTGWHLPTKEELDVLVNYAGGGEIAGKKLKTKSGWNDYEGKSGNGTDDLGFAAMPGGYRESSGNFYDAGDGGSWWSASEYDASRAYYWDIYSGGTYWDDFNKNDLASVRCLQD